MRKLLPILLLTTLVSVLTASCGEDRSGEQPFPPTVQTLSAVAEGPRATLAGLVTASPNSSLKACGFKYGNDTLRAEVQAAEPLPSFSAETDSLGAGRYFAVAYAQNGMGTSYGDTLYFTVDDVANE